MGKFAKNLRRSMRQRWRATRTSLMERTPTGLRRRLGPAVNWADMLFVDHGIFRLIYPNRHRLGRTGWRSAQPAPHQIRALARQGVRTVINLRGKRMSGDYWLEQQACAEAGIELVNYQLRSRAAPTREEILGVRALLERVAHPVLIHCKSGADRAGLMSVLYLHFHDGLPIETARHQLALRFGHLRFAGTGILDHFFESYLAYAREHPISFVDWVTGVYDPAEIKRTFRSRRWADLLMHGRE